MFPTRIETERLVLTQLSTEHVDMFTLYDLFAEDGEGVADVFEYVPQEPYQTVKQARDQLKKAEAAWDEGDVAQYAIYEADEELAGYTVLSIEWERRTGNLGFILAQSFWGQGYAGECAAALTELAFDRLDLDLVAIGHEDGNENSKRAIEKYVDSCGGQYDGVLRNWTPIGESVIDHHRYTVTQKQYLEVTT